MNVRKSLSEILTEGQTRENLRSCWDTTTPADDLGILPAGNYTAHIVKGELFSSRSNATPGYKLEFAILDGEHAGRRVWHDLWLTPAAMPQTKRDLKKIGVIDLDQLEQRIPSGIICKIKVALRRDDDGTEFNRVRSFSVERIETPAEDPFAARPSASVSTPAAAEGGVK